MAAIKALVCMFIGAFVLYLGLSFLAAGMVEREAKEIQATPLSWTQQADVSTVGWVKGDKPQRTVRYKVHNRMDNVMDLSPSLRLR